MDNALETSLLIKSPSFYGWLHKRNKCIIFNFWDKKLVSIHGAEISYMDDEHVTVKKKLSAVSTVIHNGIFFDIHFNNDHKTIWHFKTSSLEETKKWIIRLKHCISILNYLYTKNKIGSEIGKSVNSQVFHFIGADKFTNKVIKIVNTNTDKQCRNVQNEAKILKIIAEEIKHPNLLEATKIIFFGTITYFIFPYQPKGDLFEYLEKKNKKIKFSFSDSDISENSECNSKNDELDISRIVCSVAKGLQALHNRNIVHLDIKLENIVLDDDVCAKIIDFGLSLECNINYSIHHSVLEEAIYNFNTLGTTPRLVGTIGYIAPEVFLCGHFSSKADVWALGVVLYCLLSDLHPFGLNSNNKRFILEKSIECDLQMDTSIWNNIGDDAKNLIRKMLCVNPNKRISIEDILKDKWITNS